MIKYLLVVSVITLSLAGCVPSEKEATLENVTPTGEIEVTSSGIFKTGDKIIVMDIDARTHEYYFGGFIDDDTFVINVTQFSSTETSTSFYYTAKNNLEFLLPFSNTKMTLMRYNVVDGTITLGK